MQVNTNNENYARAYLCAAWNQLAQNEVQSETAKNNANENANEKCLNILHSALEILRGLIE